MISLKQSVGGLTAGDLADRLLVSLNGVRHHLRELEGDGLVARRREQRGVGAPAHLYQLTASGEDLFPRRNEELLTEALARVPGPSGRSAVLEVMEERFGALARRLQAELADATGAERLERVAGILEEGGYMAAWGETAGGMMLTEHHCAIKAVAERFPEICELEERFLREVLAAGVERTSHILNGCQVCEYSIHFPERGPDGDSGSPGITPMGKK